MQTSEFFCFLFGMGAADERCATLRDEITTLEAYRQQALAEVDAAAAAAAVAAAAAAGAALVDAARGADATAARRAHDIVTVQVFVTILPSAFKKIKLYLGFLRVFSVILSSI